MTKPEQDKGRAEEAWRRTCAGRYKGCRGRISAEAKDAVARQTKWNKERKVVDKTSIGLREGVEGQKGYN